MEVTNDPAGKGRSTARDRVLDAARSLFAEHGVSGTSLQMIADHLGVTKAAVYHQFHTKEAILVGLLEKPLAELQPVVAEAESMPTRERQLEVVLQGLVDVVLENPEAVGILQTDPAVAHLLQDRPEYREIIERLGELFTGPRPSAETRVAGALYGAGLMLIGHHPLLRDVDPDTLRSELPRIGRRILL